MAWQEYLPWKFIGVKAGREAVIPHWNHIDEGLSEQMSTKLKNIAKYRPFELEKHHNEKFLAQLLNTDISYMTFDGGQMLLRRLWEDPAWERVWKVPKPFPVAHSQSMQFCR